MRLFHETVPYLDTPTFLASAGGVGAWGTIPAGVEIDDTVLYNGHNTIRYDPAVAAGPAQFIWPLQGGFNRIWSRVVFRPADTMYATTSPPEGTDPYPLAVFAVGATFTAQAGLWSPRPGGDFKPVVRVESDAEDLSSLGAADALTAADIQALGWSEWITLTERWYGTARVRVRGWLNGALVLDQIIRNVAPTDWWTQYVLLVDSGDYDAENVVHIGEVEIWDAEWDPDPYGLGYLWGDSFNDYKTNFFTGGDPKWNYGIFAVTVDSPNAKTGFGEVVANVFGPTDADAFLGHDLDASEPEVAMHFWFRVPDPCYGPVMLCQWRSSTAQADPLYSANPDDYHHRLGNQAAIASIWYDPDTGLLSFELAAGGSPIVGTTAIPLANGELVLRRQEEYHHVFVALKSHPTDGYVYLLLDGQPELFGEDLDTQPTNPVRSLCLGHANDVGPTDPSDPFSRGAALHFCGFLATRGLEYRLAELDFLQVNGDDDPANVDWTIDDWISGEQYAPGPPHGFYFMQQDYAYEPDDSGSYMYTPNVVGLRYGFFVTDLPNPTCGGVLAAVAVQANVGLVEDADFGITGIRTYVDVGGTRDVSDTFSDLWAPDWGGGTAPKEPAQPRPGENGMYTITPKVWTRDPVSGDSWDPTTLPLIGVQSAGNELRMTHIGMMVVRVRPSNDGPATGAENVYGSGAWRAAQQQYASMGQIQPPLPNGEWVFSNGDWRGIMAGLPALSYCPDGAQPYPFIDGFDGPRLNRRVWGLGGFWPDEKILISSGKLRLLGPANALGSGFEYAGPNAQSGYPMPGGYVQVKAATLIANEKRRQQALVWTTDKNQYHLRVRAHESSGTRMIELVKDEWVFPTAGNIVASAVYGSTPFWRLRHDADTDEIVGEVSATGDEGDWTEVGRVAVESGETMGWCTFALWITGGGPLAWGGTYTKTSPGEFDDFRTSPLPHL